MRSLVFNKIQIFTNFGQFHLKELYDINEIIKDNNNELFKCYIETEILKNTKIKIKPLLDYLIISDSQLLIFSPYNNSKNLGNLLFVGELHLIEDLHAITMEESYENKIKKKNENLKDDFFKRFVFKWKNTNIYNLNNNYYKFESPIIITIDNFFHLNDKISQKKKKIFQNYELFADDYHRYFPVERLNIIDESKLVEICMYQEKCFLKDYFSADSSLKNKIDILLMHQAKEIVFFYKKLIDLMEFKNDYSILIYKNKLKDFIQLTGYCEKI